MKAKLMAMLTTKKEARTAKMAAVDKSTDVTELRGLQAELEALCNPDSKMPLVISSLYLHRL